MAYTNEPYRLYYASLDFQSGLIDVFYYVYKPDGVKLGLYLMSEIEAGTGIYFSDFTGDIEGNYLFVANCSSVPKQSEKSVFFKNKVWEVADKNNLLNWMEDIKDVEKGEWEIIGTQMIFRREGGSELMRFDLLNEAGLPTNGIDNGAPFKRVRV
jgi:hypothetical protein